jgi:hypothetical protein
MLQCPCAAEGNSQISCSRRGSEEAEPCLLQGLDDIKSRVNDAIAQVSAVTAATDINTHCSADYTVPDLQRLSASPYS